MNALVVLSALLAVAAAAPGGLLGAPLLPKVNVAPAEVTVVKQPYTVTQHEYVHRDVPVPYPVIRHEVVQPAPIAVPAIPTAYAAAPAIASYAAAPAYAAYAAPAAYGAYGAFAAPGLVAPAAVKVL